MLVLAAVTVGIVLLDRVSKAWAVDTLLDSRHDPVEVIGTLLQFQFVENSGASFGIGVGYTWVFSIIAVVVAIVIVRTARQLGSVAWAVALGGLLGGLLGNLIDRLTRGDTVGMGAVIDFIALPNFPRFNVADMAITGSAVLMVILALRGIEITGRRAGTEPGEPHPPAEATEGGSA